MPHITLPADLTGIRGPMATFYRQRAALVAAHGYTAATLTTPQDNHT
jgi:hypothetical protein